MFFFIAVKGFNVFFFIAVKGLMFFFHCSEGV